MSTKLHVASPLFIKSPYVVRVEHPGLIDIMEFRRLLKYVKTLIHGTWGYTQIMSETTGSDYKSLVTVHRSYWAFSDNIDALQFKLSVTKTAEHVYMWPKSLKFTITEYIDD